MHGPTKAKTDRQTLSNILLALSYVVNNNDYWRCLDVTDVKKPRFLSLAKKIDPS